MKKLFIILVTVSFATSSAHVSAALYNMDFSIAGQGSTHDNTGSDPLEPSPVSGENWTLSYDSLSSDGSTNEFITVAGNLMRVQDWGGVGTVTSDVILIPSNGTVDITGSGLSIGSDTFNAVGTEGITWFYSLNGGSTIETFLGEVELGGPVAAGTDVGYSFNHISVVAGDALKIGFSVNVNGTGDGVEISAMDVGFAPASVPEPTSSVLFSLAGLTYLFRRRKQS